MRFRIGNLIGIAALVALPSGPALARAPLGIPPTLALSQASGEATLNKTPAGNGFLGSEKVASWVLDHTSAGRQTDFLVVLRQQADLRGAEWLQSKAEKGAFVRDALWSVAQATQGPILDFLTSRGVPRRAYYLVNLIWVKGDRTLVRELAARQDVSRIEGNPRIQNDLPRPEPASNSPDTAEPGLVYVHAPDVWALGFTGQGVVVADQDTGQQWDHPALKSHYRGWDGSSANHDYNWHDSIHDSTGNPCGNDSPFPCDDNGHGTHTTGTAVGDDGFGNQIGMAPGAQWIGCRNMDQGIGTPARYLECFEFELAPYPVGGTPNQGDPTKAPDLTTNSWGCPAGQGCSAGTLLDAVNAQVAAGILPVAAAGNSGSSCSTVSDPPAIYASSFTAGAIDAATGIIGSFSSRGPVTADGSNRMKPDITAPGVSVRSSVPPNSYASFSGTSMAAPHVAGAVALLWSAVPSLANQIPATESLLEQNASHVSTTDCTPAGGYPNNTYGWGSLDILAAVTAATCAPVPAITVTHCLSPNTSALSASTPANAGDTYNWTITGGTIDSGQGTNSISFTSGGPATLMTLSVDETNASGCTGSAAESMQVNFNDVPASNPFYNFICTIARHAITAGCGSGNFCPANNVLRSQMAVFILRGEHGSVYVPPPAVGIFGDVPASNPFAPWIEELYNESITGGCSTNPLDYCPGSAVTRASMAVFLLVAEHGPGYVPPACMGLFTDVACPSPFADWIEQLYNEGITGGCNTNPLMYCPNNSVTRAQMAVFLTATFGLQ